MRSKSTFKVLAAFTALAFLIGCGGGGGSTHSSTPSTPSSPGSSVTLQSITVSPSAPAVTVGQSQQLTATALYSDSTSNDVTSSVTWSSSDNAVATVAVGMVSTKAQGSATISAAMGNVKGTANVIAKASAAQMTALGVAPASATLAVGATMNFTATQTLSDLTSQNLTASVGWTSSDPTVASIDNNGALTALKVGVTTITATSGSFTATSVVTVNNVSLQSIYLLPGSGSIAAGESQQFSAYGVYSDNSQQDLTNLAAWTSSNTSVATVQSGLAQSVASGTSNISATFNGMSAQGTLQVTSANLSSITISPYMPTIPAGGAQQLTATGIFSDGTSQDLTSGVAWGSDNSAVATISNSGVASGISAGSANVSACVGNVCDSTSMTVVSATLQSISVTPSVASIASGSTQQFTAIATFSDGSTQDITISASWSSSVPGSAPVNASGVVTGSAVASNVTITATSGPVSGTATLNVTSATIDSIVITPAVLTVGVNATVQFTATGIFSDGSSQDITNVVVWTSSNSTVATVNNLGVVTTSSKGSAQISGTYAGVTGSTTLTVDTATLVSISINHSATSSAAPTTNPFVMGKHTREQFYAWGNYSDGTARRLIGASWSSSKPSFASANGNGIVRSKNKTGNVTVRANFAGMQGTLAVNVTNATLSSIAIAPASATIANGTQQQYTLLGTYSDGSTQDLTLQGYWQTSSYTVATINKGLATGIAAGTVSIKASFQGMNASSASLTVTNASVQSLAISPANASVALGVTQQFTATATFSDGTQQDVSSVAQWTSSAPAVAIVGKTGLAISSGSGSTNIGATFRSASNTAVLTVN